MIPVTIGPHRLLHGDLTSGAIDALMGRERAHVIYSDPPWGPGNQKYWHTQNAYGSAPRTPWPEFLAAFCDACSAFRRPTGAPVFVEMGTRWVDELVDAMAMVRLRLRQRWTILYGPKRSPLPNVLCLFGGTCSITMPDPPHGEPVTRAVLSAIVRPGSVVLDPCTGLGMTARITHSLGGHFRGSELNAARLARTEAWLRRHV